MGKSVLPTSTKGRDNVSGAGGIYVYPYDGANSNITIKNNMITQNQTDYHAGGIWVNNGNAQTNVYLQGNLITKNVSNNTIYAGGLYATAGTAGLLKIYSTNNTIAYNETLLAKGAGVYVNSSYHSSGTKYIIATFQNDIILSNNGKYQIALDGNTDVSIKYSAISDSFYMSGTYAVLNRSNNLNVDPAFIDPLSDNYRLSSNSSLIDAGSNSSVTSPDIDGNPRPFDGNLDGNFIADIGAYEYIPILSPPSGGDVNDIVINNATGIQEGPDAIYENGKFIVVWDDRRGSDFDVYSRTIDAQGNLSGETKIAGNSDDQQYSYIAKNNSVGWVDWRLNTSGGGLYFKSSKIATSVDNGFFYPRASYDSNNQKYLVAWTEARSSLGCVGDCVISQITSGSPFLVSLSSGGQYPEIANDSINGRFLVIFKGAASSNYLDGPYLLGQIVNPDGTKYGGLIKIYQNKLSSSDDFSIAFDPTSQKYLIVFTYGGKLLGQFIKSDGASSGNTITLSDSVSVSPQSPNIYYDGIFQRYLIIWSDARDYSVSGTDIYGQFMKIDGAVDCSNFIISNAIGNQENPKSAYDPSTQSFLVVWEDTRETNTGRNIYGAILRSSAMLSLASNPENAGNIIADPEGIKTTCTNNALLGCYVYPRGTKVTLTAVPENGTKFSYFSGDIFSDNSPMTVLLDTPKSVTANFVSDVAITIDTSPTNHYIMVDGNTYVSPVTLNKTPGIALTLDVPSPQIATTGKRYKFTSWSNGGTKNQTISVPQTTETFTANLAPQYYLNAIVDPYGSGIISPTPISSDGYYDENTVVTLTPAASTGYAFTGWSGACTGTGTCTVTMDAHKTCTATFTATNTSPTLGTLTPSAITTAAGTAQTFTAVYSDADGYTNLKTVDFLVSPTGSGASAIWLRYDRNVNKVSLFNDAGTALLSTTCTPGTAGTIANTQGTINCAQTTVSGSGNNLTVNWNITPYASFASTTAKKLWMIARDNSNATSGWSVKGSWTIITTNTSPTLGTLTPSAITTVAGTAQTFTAVYSDADGYANIKQAYLRVHTAANGIYLRYDRTTNKLYLYNDAGTATVGSCTPGVVGTLTNTQGSLNCAATTVAVSGNNLTINWNITPKAAFASATARNLYMYVRDMSNLTAGWVDKGDWTIKATNVAPTLGTLTPSVLTSAPDIAQTFTAIYSDADGYANIKQAYLRVHTAANGIYLRYDRTTNKLYLYNDAGTATVGSCTPGVVGTLTNTQGSLNCAATTVAVSGNNLTINWNITPKAAFASATARNLYMYVRDMSNLTAGWVVKGRWTINGFPIATTTGREYALSAAFDGTNYLVGFQEAVGTARNIKAQLVSQSGTLVGSAIAVGLTGGIPAVAFDGTNYLLVSPHNASSIQGQFVSAAGAPVGSPFNITTAGTNIQYQNLIQTLYIIFDGNNYFVIWDDERYLKGQFVSPAGGLVGDPITICAGTGPDSDVPSVFNVGFDGNKILAVWADGRRGEVCGGVICELDIYGQLITKSGVGTSGALSCPNFAINVNNDWSDMSTIGLAFDGTNYLVAWNDMTPYTEDARLYAQLVSTSGTLVGGVIDTGNSTANFERDLPFLAFDGNNYLLIWTSTANDLNGNYICDAGEGTCWDIMGQYISKSGSLIGPEFAINTGSGNQFGALTYGGGKYLVLINDIDVFDGTVGDVYGRFIVP